MTFPELLVAFRDLTERGTVVRSVTPTKNAGEYDVVLGVPPVVAEAAFVVLRGMPDLVQMTAQVDVFETIITATFTAVDE